MVRIKEIRTCVQCGESKFFYDYSSKICAACIWWHKHHNGEVRSKPIRIRDGLKTEHPIEYNTYRKMHGRCENKNDAKYHNYGGRGIRVCTRWSGPFGFHNFYEDMGDRPKGRYSLDRINVDEGYSPDNCRWANDSVQGANRQNRRVYSDVVGVTYNKTLNLWVANLQVGKKRYTRTSRSKEKAEKYRRYLEDTYL